jgi:hypothetical protein
MKEFRTVLVKKGLRRPVIDAFCARAQSRIDGKREHPTDVDIVDMIMDDATSPGDATRPFDRRFSGRPGRVDPVWTNSGRSARPPAGFSAQRNDNLPLRLNGSRLNGGNPNRRSGARARRRTFTPLAKALRRARSVLMTCYNDEFAVLMNPNGHSLQYAELVQKARGLAERKYVHALIQYGRDIKRMQPQEATELQRTFTRAKMTGLGPVYRNFLLSLFPRELS